VFLVRKISEKTARELLLTGDVFNAEKAKQYNLINCIVPINEIELAVLDFAQKLCKQTSGQSLATIKKMLAQVQSMDINEALEYAAETNARSRSSEDCKTGISAFLNKKKITW
jgi:methylglutaconyl-CoA hydratase